MKAFNSTFDCGCFMTVTGSGSIFVYKTKPKKPLSVATEFSTKDFSFLSIYLAHLSLCLDVLISI